MNEADESAAKPDELAALNIPRSEISYRIWFALFVGFLALITFLFYYNVISFHYAVLVGFVAYMSLACSFCPLPTAWIVLWAVKEFPHPVIVAAIGALGTTIANMNDYYLLTFFFKYDALAKVRKKKYYHRAVAWFDKYPFLILTAAAFLPIPIDFVRLLAISRRYNRALFALASFLGRFPRYLVFTFVGYSLNLGNSAILAVLFVTVAIGISRVIYRPIRKLFQRKSEENNA